MRSYCTQRLQYKGQVSHQIAFIVIAQTQPYPTKYWTCCVYKVFTENYWGILFACFICKNKLSLLPTVFDSESDLSTIVNIIFHLINLDDIFTVERLPWFDAENSLTEDPTSWGSQAGKVAHCSFRGWCVRCRRHILHPFGSDILQDFSFNFDLKWNVNTNNCVLIHLSKCKKTVQFGCCLFSFPAF